VTFQQAVAQTPDLGASTIQPGLQALGNNGSRVQCTDTRSLIGSVVLDDVLKAKYPNDPRWDYGVGLRKSKREAAVWIEVHPASTSEVTTVLKKLHWLKNWLKNQAPTLDKLTAAQSYYWAATNGVHIRQGSPQARQLQLAGLALPRNRVSL
jgi:hypothetical protein